MRTSQDKEVLLAIEVLSVTIGGIMEDMSAKAIGPPADGDYLALADAFAEAGAEIILLAGSMRRLAAEPG